MSLNASCRVCQMTHVSHLTCIPISGIALVSVSLTVTHDRKKPDDFKRKKGSSYYGLVPVRWVAFINSLRGNRFSSFDNFELRSIFSQMEYEQLTGFFFIETKCTHNFTIKLILMTDMNISYDRFRVP